MGEDKDSRTEAELGAVEKAADKKDFAALAALVISSGQSWPWA